MDTNKELIRRTINEYRYKPVDDNIFELISKYEGICRVDNDYEGLSVAYFYKGETYFRMGKYEDTVKAINESLRFMQYSSTRGCEGVCYNTLGLMFSFLGYEVNALDYYFKGIDFAQEKNDIELLTTLYVNVGWLYRDLGDFEKAMSYFEKALCEIQSLDMEERKEIIDLELMCCAYIGHIYCKKGQMNKALEVFGDIQKSGRGEKSMYYGACIENFYIRVYDYLEQYEKERELVESILAQVESENDFVEFCEFYIDICEYFLDRGYQKRARQMLDCLHKNSNSLELIFVRIRIQKLEIIYNKKYCSDNKYLSACREFVDMQMQYQTLLDLSKLSSMENMQLLKQAEKERKYYEDMSRKDIMTGLFNKNTSEYLIKQALDDRHVSDISLFGIIDLDEFKEVNDTLGHLEGDKVITAAANIMKRIFAQADVIGRFGGDEFVVFYKFVHNKKEIIKKFELFEKKFEKMKFGENKNYIVTSSVGIKFIEGIDISYERMFENVDKALYQSKNMGRNRMTIAEDKKC